MKNYRIYEKKADDVYTKTSYCGNKKLMTKILKMLSKTKKDIYFIEREYGEDETK